MRLLGQILPGGIEVEIVSPGEAGEHLHVIRRGRLRLGPGGDRAALEAEGVVGDDQILVEHELLAEAVAGGAGALRRVEAEQPRLDLGDGEAADRAGELFAEDDAAGDAEVELEALLILPGTGRGTSGAGGGVGVRWIEVRQPFRQLQRGLEAVGEPRLDAFTDDDAVDHHLDVVLVFLVERRRVLDRVKLAVDADAGEARLLPFGELLAIFALAAAHHRREQVMARAFGQRHHPIDHLADLLRLDRQPGRGRVRHSDPRPQQAHVIVDFGDRGDGRARVAAGGLLLDRDRRRQSVDMLDVGLLHHLEELAGVGAEALDVAALSFRVDGIEGEARFARSAEARDHRQALAGDIDVDPLEVVLARAANADVRQHTVDLCFGLWVSIGSGSFRFCSSLA